ncbi:MAG: hypothetical protein AAGB34_01660 [Planctomycetota bacterium]
MTHQGFGEIAMTMGERWRERLPVRDGVFELIEHLHAVPQRAYHNLDHIKACLESLNEISEGNEPLEAVAAIWFHDCIYVPGAPNNETASAEIAVSFATVLGLDTQQANTTKQAILATAHQTTPHDPIDQLVVDADLSILGADEALYDQYAKDIRQEWSHVPDREFAKGRMEMMKSFLEKPKIFHTAKAADRYEQRARTNILRELHCLQMTT